MDNTIEDCIGNTPIVKLLKIPDENNIKCSIHCKLEFMNPSGSIKDRIIKRIIKEAEKSGKLKKGVTIVEASSGNTAISLAMICATKGYKLIITIPDKMSKEKIKLLKSMNAEVIVTPTFSDNNHPDSYISKAKEISQRENHFFVNQYNNDLNAQTHYEETAEEIIEQTKLDFDYIFIGSGSCGTIAGISKKIKEKKQNIKIIGIDPNGSIIASSCNNHSKKDKYALEGIGLDHIPNFLDYSKIDDWVKVDDQRSFSMSKDLLEKEGIFGGGSSGAILYGAIKYLKDHKLNKKEDIKCFLIFPDSVKNYYSTYLDDSWLINKGLQSYDYLDKKSDFLHDLTIFDIPYIKEVPYYDHRMTISDCLDIFKKGFKVIPIRMASKIIGIVTKKKLLNYLSENPTNTYKSALECIDNDFREVSADLSLTVINNLLQNQSYILSTIKDENNLIKKLFVINKEMILESIDQRIKEVY